MRITVLPDGTGVRWSELPGDGRPVVYVHGLGAASLPQFLHIVTDPVLAGRRAVLVDLPGFGFSDRPPTRDYSLAGHAEAVAAVVRDLGTGAVDLVGHSLGGSVALVLAHSTPALVDRLVVIEPNLLPWDGTASVHIARQSEQDFVTSGMDALVASADPDWVATLRLADPLAVHRTAVGLCHGSSPTMAEILANCALRRALVWGELTPLPTMIEHLVESGVALRTIAGSGHVPMIDAPTALAVTLADLLAAEPDE